MPTLMRNLLLLALYALVLLVLAWRVPPMASPDEPHHLARAWTLAQGQWRLHTPPGRMSGGEVDPALLAFTHTHFTRVTGVPAPHTVADPDAVFVWTGQRVFDEMPGAGYYWPGLYAPAALGLALGAGLGLDIATSYGLARGLSLAGVLLLVALALRLQPQASIAWLPLLLPMSLFQAASPTLDGLALALTWLTLAFYRSLLDAPVLALRRLALLCLLVAVLATVRLQMLPLLLLPAHLIWHQRWRLLRAPHGARPAPGLAVALMSLTVLAVLDWYGLALAQTVDTRVARPDSNLSVLSAYLAAPQLLAQQLLNTVADPAFGVFVFRSLVGVLGWLSWPLPAPAYPLIALTAALWLALALWRAWPLNGRAVNAVLVLAALASVLLVFVSMAINWTPLGSPTIQGIQGRYFLGSLLVLLMAWSPSPPALAGAPSADSSSLVPSVPSALGARRRLDAALTAVMVLFLLMGAAFTLAALPR